MGSTIRPRALITGWPDRIYLIDRSNRVAYKSKPGPFGFKPDDLAKALKKMMGSSVARTREGHDFSRAITAFLDIGL